MLITRRRLLAAAATACAAVPARAGTVSGGGPVIEPLTASRLSGTRYARLANPGPAGTPIPTEAEIAPGLKVRCYIPSGIRTPGTVIFSHAEMGSPQVYDRMLAHWASHGFAVFAPVHDDSIQAGGAIKALRGASWDIATLAGDQPTWQNRVAQCAGVLDALPGISESTRIRFRTGRPIIAGHSLGAFTAQALLGAAPAMADGTTMAAADPRLAGGIFLSPQGAGAMGLSADSWSGMARPLLAVTGNGDADGGVQQDPDGKIDAFKLSPPGDKHLAWFAAISNGVYTCQQVAAGTPRALSIQDLLSVTTAFLKACGDGDPDESADLSGDYYTRMTSSRITMYFR